jgi:hypothetical protein
MRLIIAVILLTTSASSAWAQQAQPAPPPQQYPPGQYSPPPEEYPPQQYQYPPQGYAYPPQPYYYQTKPPISPEEEAYRARRRAKIGLYVAGGVVFGISYVSMMFTGIICASFGSTNPCSSWSFLPVGGPFVMASYEAGHHDPYGSVGSAFVGIMEAAGLALIITAAAIPSQKPPTMTLLPSLYRGGGGGLSLIQRF